MDKQNSKKTYVSLIKDEELKLYIHSIPTFRDEFDDEFEDKYQKIRQIRLDFLNDIAWKNETRHLITPPPHENMPFLCRLK